MTGELPLVAQNYFFTHQEVIASQDHDTEAFQDLRSNVNLDINFDSKDDNNIIAAQCVVKSDNEQSENLRYQYVIGVVGYFLINEPEKLSTDEKYKNTCGILITQFLTGIIRERLHEMTSRGPWGPIVMDLMPLPRSNKNK